MKRLTPPPGSDAAYDHGCTCPMMDNHHGRGIPGPHGPRYYIAAGCRLHGRGVYGVLTYTRDRVREGFARMAKQRRP